MPLQLPRLQGNCRRLTWQFNCRGLAWQLPRIEDYRGWPWKLLWFDVRGNCRGNCRGLPWVAMLGTTEFATDRTAARAVANRGICRESAMSRGPCRGNPRISTVARGNTYVSPRTCRGLCREPPPKSQIMCICGRYALPQVSRLLVESFSWQFCSKADIHRRGAHVVVGLCVSQTGRKSAGSDHTFVLYE